MLILFLLCTFLFGAAFISAAVSNSTFYWAITLLLGIGAAICFGKIKAVSSNGDKR